MLDYRLFFLLYECPSLAMSLLQSSFVHLVVPTSAIETTTFNTDFDIETTSM